MNKVIGILMLALALYIAYSWIDRFDPETVRGKRVVITGASMGIGEQMAYHYARLGASVLITSRSEGKLKQVVEKCKELGSPGSTYHYIAADMGNIDAYEKLIETAKEKLGGIDFLVLNHILVGEALDAWKGSSANFTFLQRILDINFRAYVHIASHAMPLLETSGGSIIVVSSVAGKTAQPYIAPYAASKFALYGFFGSIRQELKLRNSPVSVSLAVIGFVGTDNAVSSLETIGAKFLLATIKHGDPSDCALTIIKGGATRDREIYYPYLEARLTTLFRDWFPDQLEMVVRYLYQDVS